MAASVVQKAAYVAVSPLTLPTPEGPIFPGQLSGAPTPTPLSMDPLVAGQLFPQAEGLATLTAAKASGICMDTSMVLEGHEVGEVFGAGLAAKVANLVALPVIDEAAGMFVRPATYLTAEGPLRASLSLAALLCSL